MNTLTKPLTPSVGMALIAIELVTSGAIQFSSFAHHEIQCDFRRDGSDFRLQAMGDSIAIDELLECLGKLHANVTHTRHNPNLASVEISLRVAA